MQVFASSAKPSVVANFDADLSNGLALYAVLVAYWPALLAKGSKLNKAPTTAAHMCENAKAVCNMINQLQLAMTIKVSVHNRLLWQKARFHAPSGMGTWNMQAMCIGLSWKAPRLFPKLLMLAVHWHHRKLSPTGIRIHVGLSSDAATSLLTVLFCRWMTSSSPILLT